MESNQLIIMIIIGVIFLILGVISLFWGKKEAGDYYRSMQEHVDVREYIEHKPDRPEPGSLGTGGKICFAVGAVVLLVALGVYIFK